MKSCFNAPLAVYYVCSYIKIRPSQYNLNCPLKHINCYMFRSLGPST